MSSLDTSLPPDYPSMLQLPGKGMVVAGAGQGIGRQVAHALARVGSQVVCVDVDGERAEHVAKEVDGVPVIADVCTEEGVATVLETVDEHCDELWGLVDIVGMARFVPFTETTAEDLDWTLGVVLRHAFLLGREAGRRLVAAGGGTMVFISSVSALSAATGHAAYGAAKAGLNSMVRTAAVELGPGGVRVNAVAPGMTLTPRALSTRSAEERRPHVERTPLRKLADPSDIAAAVLFLSSGLARHITGQTVVVDGGIGLNFPYTME